MTTACTPNQALQEQGVAALHTARKVLLIVARQIVAEKAPEAETYLAAIQKIDLLLSEGQEMYGAYIATADYIEAFRTRQPGNFCAVIPGEVLLVVDNTSDPVLMSTVSGRFRIRVPRELIPLLKGTILAE